MAQTSTKNKTKKAAGTKADSAGTQDTLRDLLVNKLKALYDTEKQLVKALPAMAKNATDEDLKQGFENHLEQTKVHVERLEQSFEMIGEDPDELECDGIRGIIADAEWVIDNVNGDAALDANLIAAAQHVEHYEMAGYQSAITWARILGQDDIADLLEGTLNEEQETSDELADLAVAKIDMKAMAGEEGMAGDGVDEEEAEEKEEE